MPPAHGRYSFEVSLEQKTPAGETQQNESSFESQRDDERKMTNFPYSYKVKKSAMQTLGHSSWPDARLQQTRDFLAKFLR
jgi:hypothetical protein